MSCYDMPTHYWTDAPTPEVLALSLRLSELIAVLACGISSRELTQRDTLRN